MMTLLSSIALDGVDHSIPGNGGLDCLEFIPFWQRILETVFFVPLCSYGIYLAWPFLEWPSSSPRPSVENTCGNKIKQSPLIAQLEQHQPQLLRAYSVVFCVELIYKILSKTGIYVLNPCHVCTVLQLALLSMDKNDPKVTQLFRFQMYVMPGALFALAFPILNTRLLPGEVLIYFVQHVFILLVPLYMLFIGANFRTESRSNTAWPLFSMSLICLYHFVFLQSIAYHTSVNLNCILCPAVSDPLGNRFWRLAAFMHQSFLVPILAKSYSYYGQMLVSTVSDAEVKTHLKDS